MNMQIKISHAYSSSWTVEVIPISLKRRELSFCRTVTWARLMATLPLLPLHIFEQKENSVNGGWRKLRIAGKVKLSFSLGMVVFQAPECCTSEKCPPFRSLAYLRAGWAQSPISQVPLPPLFTTSEQCTEQCTDGYNILRRKNASSTSVCVQKIICKVI